nr:hypothetical protein [Tanacetum cinerariifolium]
MVASVILIYFDFSEVSVGSSTSRVILLGTIPTVIPANVSTIVPDVPEVMAVIASPARSLSPPDSHKIVVARWRSNVALRSSSPSSPSTLVLPYTTIPSLASPQIAPTPFGIPHRPVILVLPSQEIPFGRPYHTQPVRERMLLTARNKLHPFPARIPANRRRFHSSSSSSPPRKRCRASPYSTSSTTHSSSPVFVGPSCKRCRSCTADSPFIQADLLPPRKRLRDASSTYCHEVSVKVSIGMDIEDSIETWVEGDIERDTKGSHEAD